MTIDSLIPNAPAGRYDGIKRPYSAAAGGEAARLVPDRLHAGRAGRQQAVGAAPQGALRQHAGRDDRQPGHAAGARRPEGDLPLRLAGGGRRNTASSMYPDQSLYPANAAPELCRRINRTLQRADQIEHSEGGAKRDWFAPIIADAEAGFGGPLNSFEIMKAFIEAGAAGVHFEDQLASEKKCGHMGGKVLIPTQAHERNLIAARLAADVMGTPTLVVARTDAESRQADHLRRRRARPPVHRAGQPHRRGLLPPEGRHGPRPLHRARHRLRRLRRPALVGDLAPQPRRGARVRRGGARRHTRASCWPTTARPRSTGKPTSTATPSPSSSASWARWATSSSSSRWPASTA